MKMTTLEMTLTCPTVIQRADSDIELCPDPSLVRTVRARIHHLRNDWKDIMRLIAAGLEIVFESTVPSATAYVPSATNVETTTQAASAAELAQIPFAVVKSVAPSSPAAEAGLEPNDMIKSFGSANALNNQKLKSLSEEVLANEGVG